MARFAEHYGFSEEQLLNTLAQTTFRQYKTGDIGEP